MRPLRYAWRQTAQLFTSHRLLWVPFLFTAAIETGCLVLLWLVPHPPFSSVLAPPLRFIAGERALHYPWHLWFLADAAMRYTYVAASLFAGAFCTGVACVMVRQTDEGAAPSLQAALAGRSVRYGRVTLLWLIAWGVVKTAITTLALARNTPGLLWIGLALSWVLQAALLYAIPVSVFEGRGIFRSLAASLRETFRHPVSTLLVTIVSTAPVVLWSLLIGTRRLEQWLLAVPERVVPLIAARLVLWTIADALLTVAIAHLWWAHRQPTLTGAPERPTGSGMASSPSVAHPAVLMAAGVLLLSGCSKNYQGERLFWKASQQSAVVLRDPSKADAEEFRRAIAAYERVTQEARGLAWGARAHMAIGSLHAVRQQPEEARKAYEQVVTYYDEFDDLALAARLAIAKTYEAEQRFERALDWYHQIIAFHPWTRTGLETPLYIAQYYTRQDKAQRAQIAYEHAADMYRKRVNDAPSQQLRNAVNAYLAMTYQQLKDWPRAAEALEALAQQPEGVDRAAVLLRLGTLYERLNRPEKSVEAYAALVKDFPDHPLSEEAREHLQRLSVLPMAVAPALPVPSPVAP